MRFGCTSRPTRQAFQALTPCLSRLTCALFAIVAPHPSSSLRSDATLSPLRGAREESSPINLLGQIPQNPRRHAPDIALAERHLVIVPRDALPVAALARVVGL